MATAEERGATATTTETTNSSYGGGAGGKVRKKPSRRQTTPYDRPPTALRPDNNNSSSSVGWLTRLVVDSASKVISYGTNRFFGPILRRQLPPPPLPPQAPDVNHDVDEEFLGSVANELTVAKSSQPIDSSNSNGISELEKLLKQNTFTRSEIVHLTELLHSRASEASCAGESEKMETSSVFGRHDEDQNEGIICHGATTSTPIFNSRVHEIDIGSPAELAKAYMGSRPSKVSPSMLGVNSQAGREDTGLLNNVPFISNSPIVPFTRKSSVSLGAAENGYVTPRSRGRSAIYNMARTPYSRVHPTSIMKGNGNKNYDFGSSKPSSPLSISEYGEKIESKSTTSKRRSLFLEDEVGSGSGSVGPIRRIRQKQNLLIPRTPHTAKQKLPLIGEANHDRLKAVVESENGSVASTSYAAGPSRSREVASRIFQHLEKLSPKEKSPGSKLVAAQDKSSKFMLNGKDDSKIEDNSNANLRDARESTSQNQEKVGETGCKESVAPLELWSSAKKNESGMPLKDVISNSLVRNGASQPPQKKRAFRLSPQVDDDVHVSRSLSEKKGPIEKGNLSTAEELKSMKTTIQPEVNKTPGFGFSKTSEFSVPCSGLALSASEETNNAPPSAVVPPFDKPKENTPPLFFFSSNVGDKLPSEFSSRKPEPKLDNSSSFFNISAPNGPQLKTTESDNGDLNHPKSAYKIGKPDTAASNGLFGKSDTAAASNGLFGKSDTAAASNGPFGSTITANLASTVTSTSTTSFGITFGSAALAPATTSAGPVVKFGSSSTDPSPSTNSISQVTGSITKPVENQTFGSSQPIVSPFSPPSSTNNIFGGSLFNNAKSDASGEEPAPSQGSSAQPVSSTSLFDNSFSNSQPSNSKPASLFGSLSSSPDTNSMAPVTSNSNSSPGIFSFGFSSSSASTNSIGSSSAATSSPFIFGNSSPAPASISNTSSSFSTGASGIFNFGGSSSAPMNSITSSGTPSNNEFTSPIFGSTSNSSNPSTGFTFGSSSKPIAPTNTAPSIFSSPSPASSSPIFSVGAASAPALSTPSQPIFGNSASGFGASFGDNNDQMNGEDSMVEDPVQSSAPAPVFGQLEVNSSPPGFMFGQTAPVQANPFQFGGQTSQVAPNPFQASSSLEFNASGSGFSLGSGGGGGGDKSNRRTVRVSKTRNRKK